MFNLIPRNYIKNLANWIFSISAYLENARKADIRRESKRKI